MTPNDIDVLLHYYTTPGPHPRVAAPAVQSSIQMFIEAGLLQLTKPAQLEVTEGGTLLVKQLCATKLPVRKWVAQ